MKVRSSLSAMAFGLALVGAVAIAGASRADGGEGLDMEVHNHTGHQALVYLFLDADVHTDEYGGTQFAHLQNGESAIAHVSQCTFSIVLVDHDDVWHAEFQDCNSTDMTFQPDTGHETKHR